MRRYIARRLVRFAAEDIGMADPNALTQALASTVSNTMLSTTASPAARPTRPRTDT